ncbi:cytoplasmic protein [Bacillus sp. LL01]|uniref:DUF4037 domain-containing protein n=1 Tax=Bacillus sp. LL01 TaxID=1665556 RepID=UPI00064D5494|nr:DUF4037 domain-containing protein [Bacillus sp. LL01]KMJ59862.1 cytoplasmic protein [Bacillus sp. LL01]
MNLKEKAIEMTAIYKENTKIEAILLAGSVAQGWEDEFSDIELHLFWKEPPMDWERRGPILSVKGEILTFHPYEDEEWSESYLTGEGIKMEISNFLSSTINRTVNDVVVKYNPCYDKQCLVSSIHDGIALHGERIIHAFKNGVVNYPNELAVKMISENLEFGSRWNNRQALLRRQDWLMYYEIICDVQKKLMGVLFGLNSIYVHHPSFKWMPYKTEQLHVKPIDFLPRMNNVLKGNPEESLERMELLVLDVIKLVEIHKPEINIKKQKQTISFVK